MNFVYYSLVLIAERTTYLRQWLRSIRSLRQFNRTIPVHLFVFNEPSKALLDLADLYEVTVHYLGSYSDCLRAIGGEAGAALSGYIPTLNKLLPLAYVPADVSQVLFLDCDTLFYGDVASLFLNYGDHQWYAREEPYSRRSPFLRYNPEIVDEDALYRIASATAAAPIPPYNTGIFMLNHGLWSELASLRKEFVSYAWRLTLGASRSPGIVLARALKKTLADLRMETQEAPIEFPGKHYWVIDGMAMSLTLGKLPGLSHGQFRMEDVPQGGEFTIYRSYKSRCTVLHYLTGNEVFLFNERPCVEPSAANPVIDS
jgi:hypothetical protein